MVYVISQDGKPLMPCSNPIARLLLKQGKVLTIQNIIMMPVLSQHKEMRLM